MKKITFAIVLLFASFARAESPTQVNSISFGKGVNYAISPTDIDDSEAADVQNMFVDEDKTIQTRFGTQEYISQAISTNAISSIFNAYASSSGVSVRSTLFSSGNSIYYSTAGSIPVAKLAQKNLSPDDWRWVSMAEDNGSGSFNDVTIGAGGYYNELKKFDVVNSSLTDLLTIENSSISVIVRGKYPLMAKNYFIIANVRVSHNKTDLIQNTTFYPSRAYYSLLAKPSSMTAVHFIDYRTNDGSGGLTGVSNLFGVTHLWKQDSIAELSFNVLDNSSNGGDIQLTELVTGFGLYAPKSLATNGQFYIFCSKDGVRLWDGGRRGRLTASEESRLISKNIQQDTLVEKVIRAGNWDKCVGYYYKKRDWYILSYIDPDKSPSDKLNSVIIYDFRSGQWFPFSGLQVASINSIYGSDEKDLLQIGSSIDGRINTLDITTQHNDSPKQLPIDGMDNQSLWSGSIQNTTDLVEGSASLKMMSSGVGISSMTKFSNIYLGEWKDGSKVSRSNANIEFKILTTSVANISSIRIDLLVDSTNQFNNNFTSFTINSENFASADSGWSLISVKLSSFTTPASWTALATEDYPFSDTLSYYGIRLTMNCVGKSTCSVDDLRLVQNTENPIDYYFKSKLYDFGTKSFKEIGQLLLTNDRPQFTPIDIDVYNDFGNRILKKQISADTKREIVVFMGSTITVLDSANFSVLNSTKVSYIAYNGISDNANIYLYDRTNEAIRRVTRESPLGLTELRFGEFGSGTTNTFLVHQIAMNQEKLFMTELGNQRVKSVFKKDLSLSNINGTLGRNATSYHQPTGMCIDENNAYVSNEGNYKLFKLSISTLGILNSVDVDFNTIGESSLASDSTYLYMAYNKFNENNPTAMDVVIEKRNKTNLGLVNRTTVVENYGDAISTRSISGDIGIIGDYIFISFFRTNADASETYYIQKLDKKDFAVIDEYRSSNPVYTVNGYAYSYLPTIKTDKINLNIEGRYFQVKYYGNDLDNYLKLYNQTFLVIPRPTTY